MIPPMEKLTALVSAFEAEDERLQGELDEAFEYAGKTGNYRDADELAADTNEARTDWLYAIVHAAKLVMAEGYEGEG